MGRIGYDKIEVLVDEPVKLGNPDKFHAVKDIQFLEKMTLHILFIEAIQFVQPYLDGVIFPPESGGKASNHAMLLNEKDPFPFPGQLRACHQPAQTSSDNDRIISFDFWFHSDILLFILPARPAIGEFSEQVQHDCDHAITAIF
jgi:hypothetical protein